MGLKLQAPNSKEIGNLIDTITINLENAQAKRLSIQNFISVQLINTERELPS